MGKAPKDELGHRLPMHAEVQAHEEKAPVSREHMHASAQRQTAADRQQGKYLARDRHRADHEPEHGDQHKRRTHALQYAVGGMLPAEQGPAPAPVKDMMKIDLHDMGKDAEAAG